METNGKPQLLGADGLPLFRDRQNRLDAEQPGFVMPHVLGFGALLQGASKTYFREIWDEAMRHSRENALAMRRDEHLQACLRERKRATTSLKWNLESDNPKDPWQKAVCTGIERIIRATPHLRKLMKVLKEDLWYGRYGIQEKWQWKNVQVPVPRQGGISEEQTIPGMHLVDWIPLNGDKIDYKWDGTPTVRLYGGRTEQFPVGDLLNDNLGYSLILNEKYRERFLISTWEVDDADFFEPERASVVHGLGMRDWLYWSWWTKNEYMTAVVDGLERFGLGFIIINYDASNEQARLEAEKVGKNYSRRSVLLIPKDPATMKSGSGVEVIQTPVAGMEVLLMLQQACEARQERFIIGQSMSSSPKGASSLGGGGPADFERETKWDIVEEDSQCLGETLTGSEREPGLISVIKKWTYPWADFPVRWVFHLDPNEAERKMGTIAQGFNMGMKVPESELQQLSGISAGDSDEKMLQNPAFTQLEMQQQQAAMGQTPGGQAGPEGQPPPEGQPQGPQGGPAPGQPGENPLEGMPSGGAGQMESQGSGDETFDKLMGAGQPGQGEQPEQEEPAEFTPEEAEELGKLLDSGNSSPISGGVQHSRSDEPIQYGGLLGNIGAGIKAAVGKAKAHGEMLANKPSLGTNLVGMAGHVANDVSDKTRGMGEFFRRETDFPGITSPSVSDKPRGNVPQQAAQQIPQQSEQSAHAEPQAESTQSPRSEMQPTPQVRANPWTREESQLFHGVDPRNLPQDVHEHAEKFKPVFAAGVRAHKLFESVRTALENLAGDKVKLKDNGGYTVNAGGRFIEVHPIPSMGLADIGFGHESGVDPYSASKSLQSGSIDFMRKFRPVVKAIADSGLNISYTADADHAKLYDRALPKFGYEKVFASDSTAEGKKHFLWTKKQEAVQQHRDDEMVEYGLFDVLKGGLKSVGRSLAKKPVIKPIVEGAKTIGGDVNKALDVTTQAIDEGGLSGAIGQAAKGAVKGIKNWNKPPEDIPIPTGKWFPGEEERALKVAAAERAERGHKEPVGRPATPEEIKAARLASSKVPVVHPPQTAQAVPVPPATSQRQAQNPVSIARQQSSVPRPAQPAYVENPPPVRGQGTQAQQGDIEKALGQVGKAELPGRQQYPVAQPAVPTRGRIPTAEPISENDPMRGSSRKALFNLIHKYPGREIGEYTDSLKQQGWQDDDIHAATHALARSKRFARHGDEWHPVNPLAQAAESPVSPGVAQARAASPGAPAVPEMANQATIGSSTRQPLAKTFRPEIQELLDAGKITAQEAESLHEQMSKATGFRKTSPAPAPAPTASAPSGERPTWNKKVFGLPPTGWQEGDPTIELDEPKPPRPTPQPAAQPTAPAATSQSAPQAPVKPEDILPSPIERNKPEQNLLAPKQIPGEPPLTLGNVRMYHGGDPNVQGGRWLTPDKDYAKGYADKSNSPVMFVDVPENHPMLEKAFDDTGATTKAPYKPFEADEALSSQLKPLGEPTAEPTAEPTGEGPERVSPEGQPARARQPEETQAGTFTSPAANLAAHRVAPPPKPTLEQLDTLIKDMMGAKPRDHFGPKQVAQSIGASIGRPVDARVVGARMRELAGNGDIHPAKGNKWSAQNTKDIPSNPYFHELAEGLSLPENGGHHPQDLLDAAEHVKAEHDHEVHRQNAVLRDLFETGDKPSSFAIMMGAVPNKWKGEASVKSLINAVQKIAGQGTDYNALTPKELAGGGPVGSLRRMAGNPAYLTDYVRASGGFDTVAEEMAARHPEFFADKANPLQALWDMLTQDGWKEPMPEEKAWAKGAEMLSDMAPKAEREAGVDAGEYPSPSESPPQGEVPFHREGSPVQYALEGEHAIGTQPHEHPHFSLGHEHHAKQMAKIPIGGLEHVWGFPVRRHGPDEFHLETDEGPVRASAEHMAHGLKHAWDAHKVYGKEVGQALERASAHNEPDPFEENERHVAEGQAFSNLPHGTPVVSLHPKTYGRLGEIVHEPDQMTGQKRVRVKLEGTPHWESGHVEPLDEKLSWRAKQAAQPEQPEAPQPSQGQLFEGSDKVKQSKPFFLAPKVEAKPMTQRETDDFFEVKPEQGNLFSQLSGKAKAAPPPEPPPQAASSVEEKKARFKELRSQMEPLAKKGNLTAEEAARFKAITSEMNGMMFDAAEPLTTDKVPSEMERRSTLSPETVVAMQNDLIANKSIYTAIAESAAGVNYNANTPVDDIVAGKNPNVSAQEFRDAFSRTREALRSQYGDTIKAYRAVGKQMKKPTENWATTREYASQFGPNVVEQDIPVDSIIAANVGTRGRYHELIVDANAKNKPTRKEPPQAMRQPPPVQGTLFQRLTSAIQYAIDNDGDPEEAIAYQALCDRIEQARKETDCDPSEDQKKAGNYRKGKVMMHGMEISIENPKGSTRSGKCKDGKEWTIKMAHDYGYIRKTESEADGDHVDVFIGPDPESQIVFVIDQQSPKGRFDEHKCMLGFHNETEAKQGYLDCYSSGWKGFGGMAMMLMPQFKEWIANGETGKRAVDQVDYQEEAINYARQGLSNPPHAGAFAKAGQGVENPAIEKPLVPEVPKVPAPQPPQLGQGNLSPVAAAKSALKQPQPSSADIQTRKLAPPPAPGQMKGHLKQMLADTPEKEHGPAIADILHSGKFPWHLATPEDHAVMSQHLDSLDPVKFWEVAQSAGHGLHAMGDAPHTEHARDLLHEAARNMPDGPQVPLDAGNKQRAVFLDDSKLNTPGWKKDLQDVLKGLPKVQGQENGYYVPSGFDVKKFLGPNYPVDVKDDFGIGNQPKTGSSEIPVAELDSNQQRSSPEFAVHSDSGSVKPEEGSVEAPLYPEDSKIDVNPTERPREGDPGWGNMHKLTNEPRRKVQRGTADRPQGDEAAPVTPEQEQEELAGRFASHDRNRSKVKHLPVPEDVLRNETPMVTEVMDSSGGNEKTHNAHFPSGHKAKFKKPGDEREARPGLVPKGEAYKREAAVSDISEYLDVFRGLVPRTIIRDIPGHGVGSMQSWVPDDDNGRPAKTASQHPDPYDGPKNLARAALFDYLIGATDRHRRNWMIPFSLIDNGLALPKDNSYFDSDLFRAAKDKGLKMPNILKDWTDDKFFDMAKKLKAGGIDDKSLDALRQRWNWILLAQRDGKFSFNELAKYS